MGNSVGPGHVPMCLSTAENPGLPTTWDPERTPRIFSPLRMVQDASVGGSSGQSSSKLKQTPDEFLEEVKKSEVWKNFMKMFDDSKPRLEAGEGEEESADENESIREKIEAYSHGVAENRGPVDKEALKTNLHKLKEKTGFPYLLCKKALEDNNNDLEKAEKWLEEESKELGLEKMKKIEKRMSAEGLVGVAWDKHHAAMVEVNSESDFVSSNEKFHELVDLVAKTCLQHTKENNPSPKNLSKVMLKGDEMGNLVAEDKQSLSDHMTKAVALMGERLRLRRAALISAEESARLAVLTHPSEPTEYRAQGRLGTVLVYKANDYNDCTLQVANYLCQQIIGMNPKSVEPSEGGNKETALLTQKYIREPTQTVAEVIARAGLKVEHFVRFERGEPSEAADDLGTEPAKPLC